MGNFDAALRNAMSNPDIEYYDEEAEVKRKGGAQRVTVDGITFDSRAEAKRHQVLVGWQTAGVIAHLDLKPKFILQPAFETLAGVRVQAVTWTADWLYHQVRSPYLIVVEDFKGYQFRSFRVKLPFILHVLRDKHIFINEDLNGWYDPVVAAAGRSKHKT